MSVFLYVCLSVLVRYEHADRCVLLLFSIIIIGIGIGIGIFLVFSISVWKHVDRCAHVDVCYLSVGLFYLLVGLFFLLHRCAHRRMHPCNNEIGGLIIHILFFRTYYCIIIIIIILLGASARVAAGHLA
jgi:hypothetical protein